jgi:uncharacterized membrane protein
MPETRHVLEGHMKTIGVLTSYAYGWRALWAHFLPLFIVGLAALVLLAPASVMGQIGAQADGFLAFYFGVSALLYHVLLRGPVEYGVKYVYLRAAREQSIELRHMLEAFRNYANVILANFLVALIVGIGLLMFVVPGIVFACKLAFTPYLVVDARMGAWDALQESWRMTTGYAWRIFCVGLLAIPICFVGLLLFGVGIVFAIMWVRITFASIYDAVDELEAPEGQGAFV